MLTTNELLMLVLAAVLGSLAGLIGGFVAPMLRDRRLCNAMNKVNGKNDTDSWFCKP